MPAKMSSSTRRTRTGIRTSRPVNSIVASMVALPARGGGPARRNSAPGQGLFGFSRRYNDGRGRRRSDPAFQLAPDDGLDHRHAVVAHVEARDMGEILAAGMGEDLAHLAVDLLQRLDAVGGE